MAMDSDAAYDVENMVGSPTRAKTIAAAERDGQRGVGNPASSVLAKVRTAKRHAESSPLKAKDAGVRKTSGRIGSVGSGPTPSPARKASVT